MKTQFKVLHKLPLQSTRKQASKQQASTADVVSWGTHQLTNMYDIITQLIRCIKTHGR
jgi:hypothetical protein